MEETKVPGLIPDPRSEEEKAKDFQHEEIHPSGAVTLNWSRDITGAPKYSDRFQNGSGSCVGQGLAKGIETTEKKVISAHPIYARRINIPGFGMWLQDGGRIVSKLGTTTEALDPSQGMTEAQMNAPVTVDTPIKRPLYVMVDVQNIDKIAEAIELYKHCAVTIGSTLEEYEFAEKPIHSGKPADMFHCICATYYFTDEHGEKCIVIDESWGANFLTRRIFTESWLKARGTGAMYFLPNDGKPHYTFATPLTYGMMNNVDVKYLQDILKEEGFFPKTILSTGNYLQITAQAVLSFQRKHQVAPETELAPLAGKRVGAKTILKLNELYGS